MALIVKLPDFFACAFFAVLFIQSGLDKLFDRKGNIDYLTGHFQHSPLKGMVGLLFPSITLLELSAGFGSATAAITRLVSGPGWIPVVALSLAALALLCLFAGQRIAKDYAGAGTLAIYFGVALLSLYLVAAHA